MTIIYGSNYFELLTVNPNQLEMSDVIRSNFKILLIQRYAHIFFIPLYATHQEWVLKAKDGKLYDAPADIVNQLIAQNIWVRTPWYSYTWIWLLILTGVALFANSYYKEYQFNLNKKLAQQERAETIRQHMEKPGSHDYYSFRPVNFRDASYHCAKVIGHSKSALQFLVVKEPGYMLDFIEADDLVQYFDTLRHNVDTTWVAKSKLLETLKAENYGSYGELILNDTNKYYVDVFRRLDAPEIWVRGSYQSNDSLYHITIENRGRCGTIVSLVEQQGDVVWPFYNPINLCKLSKAQVKLTGKPKVKLVSQFYFDLLCQSGNLPPVIYRVERKEGEVLARRLD